MAKVVLKLGDDVSTDTIYPGRFMATVLPAETPRFAFADFVEINKKLNNQEIPPGSIVIAGSNFGCGSSREQAASCLKGHELIVVAKSIARIFLQNAVNLGLRVVIAPGITAAEGDEIDFTSGSVYDKTTDKKFESKPLPPAQQAIIKAGGLVLYARKKLLEGLEKR
jgi:3-isopropylmalate/(R)-2-methylmalate dehydratase small subunit